MRKALAFITVTALLGLSACSGASEEAMEISGSSTVAPITNAIARQGRFDVAVEEEGTIDGFKRFCAGETVINNASTAIPAEMIDECDSGGVDSIELPVGLDALTVVRNEKNTFATDITTDELKTIFAPDSTVTKWSDVRDGWPEEDLKVYGRGEGSGTFETFTQTVNGEVGAIRNDYEITDDMAELATRIAEDENAIGFMGIGNYLAADGEQRDLITNVAIDGVMPSLQETQSGNYPMARPLFLYVAAEAAEKDENVSEFVDYYLDHADEVLPRVRFYAFDEDVYELSKQRWESRATGAMSTATSSAPTSSKRCRRPAEGYFSGTQRAGSAIKRSSAT